MDPCPGPKSLLFAPHPRARKYPNCSKSTDRHARWRVPDPAYPAAPPPPPYRSRGGASVLQPYPFFFFLDDEATLLGFPPAGG